MSVQTVTGMLGADGPYWEALAAGRLALPRCTVCGTWHWPAVWRCGACGSWTHDWHDVRMLGSVFSWARTWHRFGGTEAFELPFVSVVVLLNDAPIRLMGVIDGDETQLRIGAPVIGHNTSTHFMGADIPSLRWTLTNDI